MRIIHKYQLKTTDSQLLESEGFNEFLKVAEQNGNICIWCLVNKEDKSIYTAKINIVGTGVFITDKVQIHQVNYFDSVFMKSGYVWHIFIN